ncbi:hypothetical protein CVT25_007233 [Psilocybe cyanescens]|uniref:Uncharacterized protein n=1 Tax=Psilocybe cyanescens TaxID=93625 RepID=A0A409XVT8_PSICY|nr:hypothetical protein CVT25_007233 [Psilocybe cyanescens]
MFPPEIVDVVVNNLPILSDDAFDATALLTLLSCSLALRSFAAAPRRRLYSTITIGQYKRQASSTFMQERPMEQLGPRIQTLTDFLANDRQSNLVLAD